MISAGSEECAGVSAELLTEQEWVFTGDKLFEPSPPLQQLPLAEVLAVQMKKVEGAEDQALGKPANS